MAKFMIEASYTAEGLRGLQKDKASGRRAAVMQAFESAGGKLDAMYFALGKYDVIAIADLPDAASAAAIAITVSASGLVRTRTTALMTVEETDAALQKSMTYKPPGK